MDLLREVYQNHTTEYVPLIEAIDAVVAQLYNNDQLKEAKKGTADWAGVSIDNLFFAMNNNGNLEGPFVSKKEAEQEISGHEWIRKGSELKNKPTRLKQAKRLMKQNKRPIGYFDELNEAKVKSMASDLRSKGGKINNFQGARGNNKGTIGGAKDFFKANPGLTIAAGAMALDAYGRHKTAKRNTVHLHARDAQERKMMTSIVDALQREGKFKIQKVKFERGGKTWTLRRHH